MKASVVVAAFVVALLPCDRTFGIIAIDTVPVGDIGNAKDTVDSDSSTPGVQSFGAVGYAYNIGKYEVTVSQYAAFLNAVAATDTYSLYDSQMGTDLNVAGIARSGSSGSYTYSVIGSPNRPVTFVNWGNAARFANWLNNGQRTGAQDASTTENGAYSLNGATSQSALNAVSRNANAVWFLPSESEWYKAAYYQPAAQGGDSDGYWSYPQRSNSAPYSDQPPGTTPDNTRVANCRQSDGIANGYDDGFAVSGSSDYSFTQNYLTDVGAYASSPSYYGTYDQGGNVWEWNEGLWFLNSFRSLRGGSFGNGAINQSTAERFGQGPLSKGLEFGFRVASVAAPEPSTTLLAASVLALLAGRRFRRS